MKNGSRLHRTWLLWAENIDALWMWRPVCWFTEHDPYWNYGRTYCVICGKTISKDEWRIKRDLESK